MDENIVEIDEKTQQQLKNLVEQQQQTQQQIALIEETYKNANNLPDSYQLERNAQKGFVLNKQDNE